MVRPEASKLDRATIAWLENEMHVIQQRAASLKRDAKRDPGRVETDLHKLLLDAHELRGFLRSIENHAKLNARYLAYDKMRIDESNPAFAKALNLAKEEDHDAFAADRDLTVILNAIKILLGHRARSDAYEAALMKLEEELVHLRGFLTSLRKDLRSERSLN